MRRRAPSRNPPEEAVVAPAALAAAGTIGGKASDREGPEVMVREDVAREGEEISQELAAMGSRRRCEAVDRQGAERLVAALLHLKVARGSSPGGMEREGIGCCCSCCCCSDDDDDCGVDREGLVATENGLGSLSSGKSEVARRRLSTRSATTVASTCFGVSSTTSRLLFAWKRSSGQDTTNCTCARARGRPSSSPTALIATSVPSYKICLPCRDSPVASCWPKLD
ncbi:hypothetical protein VaNZ11_011981 [Volvox africanus]|uniref:Uncharacterized protein n=1 Tax=Volvox africanus TaxID=51714 RepID=A0ABQ5SCR4_9CHLO|nr:hypothetical protein VaNZ11_011981 [Volvox africanus]